MADNEGNIYAHNYFASVQPPQIHFHVKGAGQCDWGMQKRLSNIFSPKDGRTVMLAFDHGYMMGPTGGVERMDLCIPPLMEYVDVLMATRGALRSCIPANNKKGIALRCTAGSSVLQEDMSREKLAVDIEDAIRINADCMAVQTYIGSENECTNLETLNLAVNKGYQYGIPVLGVVAVGKQMARSTRFFLLATRILAEMGANLVKTYYCENFSSVAAACPVPLVVAGGKKIPEEDALKLVYDAMEAGAAGVDMGRNIFQAQDPVAMVQAVQGIVHGGLNDREAYEFYLDKIAVGRNVSK